MSEQEQTMAAVDVPMGPPAGETPGAPRPQPQTISDPRQIAAVVMARMNLINTKKDELTIAMKGLTDLTQQLVQAYAGQMQVIEQLATRLNRSSGFTPLFVRVWDVSPLRFAPALRNDAIRADCAPAPPRLAPCGHASNHGPRNDAGPDAL